MTDRVRVAVVSPDEATRALVRLTLGEQRYDVVAHVSLDAAVRGIMAATPQVLILDVPIDVETLELLRTLRTQPHTAAISTLILVERGQQVPSDADGVDAALIMPSTAFALLRKVDELVARDAE